MSLIKEFLQSPAICLKHFCKLPATEEDENGEIKLKTGTFPINDDQWQQELTHYTESTKSNASYDVKESGLYCFWWLGRQEKIGSAFNTHYLKGKKLGDDSNRLKKGLQHESEDGYIIHRLTWEFARDPVTGQIPLYVGKGSSIFKRVKLHVQWPKKSFPAYSKPAVVDFIKHGKSVNSQTQFRKPFEYLFQEETDEVKRTQLLLDNVGISFINRPFHDVAARFFGEDELIGALRPPFNLDSER